MSLHRHPALSRHPEQQYLDLLRDLLRAPVRETRNDTATRSLFGRQMRFDLAHGFPLLTTKRLPLRVIAGELLWFLSGSTNVRPLQEQGITIWDEWADPKTGDLGPIYGKQMRAWSGQPIPSSFPNDEGGETPAVISYPVDQVDSVLQSLGSDPYGRRHVMTLWNPADLPDMALPPCHGIAIQFYVGADERLNLFMHQRSGDAFLGVPFNIASYALLLSMFAHVLGRQPGEFVHSIGDAHLYGNHVTQAEQQVLRDPRPLPTLTLSGKHRDMDHWSLGDMWIEGYEPWPHIAAEVSA